MKISFPRGDTYAFPFGLFADDQRAELEIDNIWFTVKKRYTDHGPGSVLIQKTLQLGTIDADDEGGYVVRFRPEDTRDLPFGMYVFDIQVEGPDITRTFLGQLELTGEVTHHGDEAAEIGQAEEAAGYPWEMASDADVREIIEGYGKDEETGETGETP